jgi:hypothetical protein
MSINFLLQSIRIFHSGNFDDTEIEMTYDHLKRLDDRTLIKFYNTNSILSYENDLEVCIEVLDIIMYILEGREEYEKCAVLKNIKDESLDIMKPKIKEK